MPRYPCIQCRKGIRRDSKALECELCKEWCHIRCGIDISTAQYELVTAGKMSFEWTCRPCGVSVHPPLDQSDVPSEQPDIPESESTRLSACEIAACGRARRRRVVPQLASVLAVDPPQAPNNASDDALSQDITNSLYADDLGGFAAPQQHEEPTLVADTAPPRHVGDNGDITYRHAEAATIRGRTRLVDSLGYSYARRPVKTTNAVYWRCSVRNKTVYCRATVTERNGAFTRGQIPHTCQPEIGQFVASTVTKAIKEQATQRIFVSAAEIVEEVLLNNRGTAPGDALPKPVNLVRAANRARQKLRPEDPVTLEFVICHEYLPANFLQGDVFVDDRRHILLASRTMLELLGKAKTWYADATFKVVRAPFTQLFAVHAFVRNGTCIKQVPLAFCLMSGKRKSDYMAVLQQVIRLLPTPLAVRRVVVDFEAALWEALRELHVLRHIEVKGCLFHLTQAIWRKMQDLGMREDYIRDVGTHKVCRQLMSLALLPAAHIPRVFGSLRPQEMSQQSTNLFAYMHDTWVHGPVWSPQDWSVFGMTVRTNNDAEGWHLRLNHRGKRADLPFYLLIELLHRESKVVSMQAQLVLEEKLTRDQRKRSRLVTAKLFDLWDEYSENTRSAHSLLDAGSKLICPRLEES